jgi:hypothetical protein
MKELLQLETVVFLVNDFKLISSRDFGRHTQEECGKRKGKGKVSEEERENKREARKGAEGKWCFPFPL